MTDDVIALLPSPPTGDDVLAVISELAPGLHAITIRGGVALELLDHTGRSVLSIESATRVAIPGEATRLLGMVEEPTAPCWWVELRCPAGTAITSMTAGTSVTSIAGAIADELASRFGGSTWRSPPGT